MAVGYWLLAFFFLVDFQAADGTAEHVTGVGESEQHVVKKPETAVVTIGHEMAHGFIDIVLRIEGFDEVFLPFLLMRMLAVDLLVVGAHILLLNESGVGEHKRTEVARRRRTIYIPAEAHFVDIGDESGMVDMRMAEHNAV